ncbi:MAG: hypothetical protein JKY65_28280 [Planctomycetes bacterium]|nr:hypothetical protein [Planctomycetota bacterium]
MRAFAPTLLALCALAAAPCLAGDEPRMAFGAAPVHSGVVVAAPHEGFDSHTAPMARQIAVALGTGWVTATNFRRTRLRRWFDVNRPTQRFWVEGRRTRGQVTERGTEVYAQYQKRVDAASGRSPLDLIVEIHGHARRAEIEGVVQKVHVIELATRGFKRKELVALKARYDELLEALPEEDRVALAVEQLNETYVYRGVEIQFYFGASGSKRAGSLSAKRSRRALHFECPSHVRFDPKRRERYVKLFTEVLRPLLSR